MKNSEQWVPTKYELKDGVLRGSRNPKKLSVSSRLMSDKIAGFYQKYLPLHAQGRLADLGCGYVPFYMAYKDLVTTTTCVDWPNSAHKNDLLDVTCDLNQPLPLPDHSADTIVLSDVLEHIANPTLLWQEMTRVLAPGGKILMNVPFFYKIHEAPFDYYRYTEFALRNFAETNGFSVLVLDPIGGLPEVFTDLFAKNLVKIPAIGTPLAKLLQALCGTFVRSRRGKRVSANTGRHYPLGYFMIAEKAR